MISSPLSTVVRKCAEPLIGIALVEIIRLHPALQQAMHQRDHDFGRVVDVLQQHGLAAQRNAGIGQPGGGFGHFAASVPWDG